MSEHTQTAASAREILVARARALAKPPHGDEQKEGNVLHVVEFRLAHERYAIEQKFVREVCVLKDLTRLPCTPPFVLGIINVRGQILPVIDVKKFFEIPETGITDLHMVIIVRWDNGAGEPVELGILADAVVGTRAIPPGIVQASLPTLTGIRAQYLKGVTDQHVVILDVPSILNDPKIVVNDQFEG